MLNPKLIISGLNHEYIKEINKRELCKSIIYSECKIPN